MKTKTYHFILTASFLLLPYLSFAQSLKPQMQEVYESYKRLQVYLSDSEKFTDTRNAAAIKTQLERLKRGFHKAEQVPSSFKDEVGFLTTMQLVQEMLDDSYKRFNAGNTSYAFWRLKTVANHCASCHVTHNTRLTFLTQDEAPNALTERQKIEFYLSTRQFHKAHDLIEEAIKREADPYNRMNLLRRWLTAGIQNGSEPKMLLSTLLKIQSDISFSKGESAEIGIWITSLSSWEKEESRSASLQIAEGFIRDAASFEPNQINNLVLLSRGASVLQTLLERNSLKNQERARALNLLGIVYSKSTVFIDELPEMYFEKCIEEFSGTDEAKSAFANYENVVLLRFSGSGGAHIPDELRAHLMDLYRKANGIPDFSGKV